MKSILKKYFLLGCIFCPVILLAQDQKKIVTNASELPRFAYNAPVPLKILLIDSITYNKFAAILRTDLEGILQNYEISDETTLKNIYNTLAHLDMQEGRPVAALEKIRLIHELESKPDLKLYTTILFETEAMARAQKLTGKSNGLNFSEVFGQQLTEMFNQLPVRFYDQVKITKMMTDFMDDKFLESTIETSIAPEVKKNGNKINNELASQIVETQTMQQFFVPLANDIRKTADAYLTTHKMPEKINIWIDRNITLMNTQKLQPVTVAIWDSGIDPTVFKDQLFVNEKESANGKDNDANGFVADVNGIGIDNTGKLTTAPLFVLYDSDIKKIPGYIHDVRVADQFIAGVENEETNAFKIKMQSATPQQIMEQSRLYDLFSFYNHGTQVASIAVAGNPAACILNARFTWRDNAESVDNTQTYEQWALGFAKNVNAFADYFKKQKVRVVNISWSMTRTEVEDNLEKEAADMNSADRKILAGKIFTIIRNSLQESIKNAPEILFVVSAGNRDSDAGFNEAIPASFDLPNMITVGAVNAMGAAVKFTSFGKTVSLYALGLDIETMIPGAEKLKFSGTSAAAPQVTNLAAKLLALNSKLTVSQLIEIIQTGAGMSDADKRIKLINPKRSMEMLLALK